MIENLNIKNKRGLNISLKIEYKNQLEKRPIIILLHGFLSNKQEAHILKLSQKLAEEGYIAVSFDASGLGESEGDTINDFRFSHYEEDLKVIYNYLLSLDFVDINRIGFFGHSMGGILSMIFASSHPEIKCLCVVSVANDVTATNFSTPLNIWKEMGWFIKEKPGKGIIKVPYAFVEDFEQYNLYEFLPTLKCPKLIIGGLNDTRINYEHTLNIYNLSPDPKELVGIDCMGHDYKNFPEFIDTVNTKAINYFNNHINSF